MTLNLWMSGRHKLHSSWDFEGVNYPIYSCTGLPDWCVGIEATVENRDALMQEARAIEERECIRRDEEDYRRLEEARARWMESQS